MFRQRNASARMRSMPAKRININSQSTTSAVDFSQQKYVKLTADDSIIRLSPHLDRPDTNPIARSFLISAFGFCGQTLVSIQIEGKDVRRSSSRILGAIAQHCKVLKTLNLSGFEISNVSCQQLKSTVLAKLSELTLNQCSFEDGRTLSNLFLFKSIYDTFTTQKQSAPCRAGAFTFCSNDIRLENLAIQNFLSQNLQVKKLRLLCDSKMSFGVIGIIERFLPNIEKLILTNVTCTSDKWHRQIQKLTQFQHLRSLKVDCDNKSISSILEGMAAAHVPLESLELHSMFVDSQFAEALGKWTQLKKFGLHIGGEPIDIQRILENFKELVVIKISDWEIDASVSLAIARNAPKLHRIVFVARDYIGFDTNWYMELLAIVKRRNHGTPVECCFDREFSCQEMQVPTELLMANDDFLRIIYYNE